jgi:hypothetical protein
MFLKPPHFVTQASLAVFDPQVRLVRAFLVKFFFFPANPAPDLVWIDFFNPQVFLEECLPLGFIFVLAGPFVIGGR